MEVRWYSTASGWSFEKGGKCCGHSFRGAHSNMILYSSARVQALAGNCRRLTCSSNNLAGLIYDNRSGIHYHPPRHTKSRYTHTNHIAPLSALIRRTVVFQLNRICQVWGELIVRHQRCWHTPACEGLGDWDEMEGTPCSTACPWLPLGGARVCWWCHAIYGTDTNAGQLGTLPFFTNLVRGPRSSGTRSRVDRLSERYRISNPLCGFPPLNHHLVRLPGGHS